MVSRVIVVFDDGTRRSITGTIVYEVAMQSGSPRQEVHIRVPDALIVAEAPAGEIQLPPCDHCGAAQGSVKVAG